MIAAPAEQRLMAVDLTASAMPLRSNQDLHPPQPHRCPVCGLSMVASKSQPESERYDVFRCSLCNTVINLSGANVGVAATDK